MTTPMFRVRPEARLEAFDDTTYPSRAAASSTFAFDTGETCPRPLSARETVAVDTPASFATSSMPAIAPRRSPGWEPRRYDVRSYRRRGSAPPPPYGRHAATGTRAGPPPRRVPRLRGCGCDAPTTRAAHCGCSPSRVKRPRQGLLVGRRSHTAVVWKGTHREVGQAHPLGSGGDLRPLLPVHAP